MNLSKNIKKAAKIEKKVLFKKVFAKIRSKFSNFFNERKDLKDHTYNIYDNLSLILCKIDLPGHIEFNKEYVHSIQEDSHIVFGHQIKLEQLDLSFPFPKEKLDPLLAKTFASFPNLNNWDKDYIGNFQWEKSLWYKKIKYGNVKGADIKVPWEIGRLQFLPPLALQLTINSNQNIASKIREYILGFVAANPPRFGTQWMTSMDIAIRAINILLALNILKQHQLKIFNSKEETLILSYLVDHGLHIEKNLEFSQGMRGNHYYANIVGILSCAIMIENYPSRIETIKKYSEELVKETEYQFYKDGFNFEASIPYHFFMLEMLEFALNLLKQSTIQSDSLIKLQECYYKIHTASQKLIVSGKFIPQIGDNDSGYLYNLLPTFDLFEIKEEILNRMMLTNETKGYYLFEESGLYVNHSKNYSFILKCGKIGQNGKGGHDHNDHTSFELFVHGKPFIVDPGTYNYTAYHEERNKYRSSYMHNTFLPINEEQNLFEQGSKDDLFWLSEIRTNASLSNADEKHVAAIHKAFHSVAMRKVYFEERSINVSDTIEKSGDKTLRLFLHPKVEIESKDCCFILKSGDTKIQVKCINKGVIKEYSYSPEYLQKENSLYLEFATHEKNIEWIIEILD